jgi:DNA gyrase inhibitor GyrI
LHSATDAISEHNKITGYTSLYKVGPKIYRAGVSVAEEPKNLPPGIEHTRFKGGKYSQIVLTGRFADLPEASRRLFEIVAEKKVPLRDDFCIEHYVTDPRNTPEDQNVVEMAVPTV